MSRNLSDAARALLRAKSWSAVVLASLALGIGANTALFSAVNGLLLRDIPAIEPERLVRLRWTGANPAMTGYAQYGHADEMADGRPVTASFSRPVFKDLHDANRTLDGMFACAPADQWNVVVDGRAEMASGFLASGGYFEVLGTAAYLGRVFGPEDDHAAAAPVVVLSHAYWTRRFGRDPEVVGGAVTVNGTPVTIVGVLPSSYRGIRNPLADPPDVHLPLAHEALVREGSRPSSSATWWLLVMGRLRPEATLEQVRGNLGPVFQGAVQTAAEASSENRTANPPSSRSDTSSPAPRLLVDSGRRGAYDPEPGLANQTRILGAVVALILVIVCANVANLLLARATARQREMSIRMSLGAPRRRVVLQLLTEGVAISVLGGGLGLVAAHAGRRFLPCGESASFDGRVFAFAFLLSVGAGLAASLVPALRATREDLLPYLNESGHGVARPRSRLGRTLLVGQVAVSLVLLVGAGVFLKTLQNLRAVDVGFDPRRVLTSSLDPLLNGYEGERAVAVYERVAEAVRSLPEVVSVGMSDIPFLGGAISMTQVYEGSQPADPTPHTMTVSPELFDTLGIPILAGRGFQRRDDERGPRVALVNQAAARAWFESESPLGRRLGFYPGDHEGFEIVGVVGDVKNANLRAPSPPTLYRPHAQSEPGSRLFLVRTARPPELLIPAVRAAVAQVDPTLPLMDVSTQSGLIEERLAEERLFARAYSLFGGLATLLTSIGLFGLASYDVTQRTREIGVRMALGAESAAVTRMVLRESLALVALGLALGLAATLAAGRLVASLLFGLEPWDGVTLAQAAAVLVSAATAASLLPARHASKVDPLLALRAE